MSALLHRASIGELCISFKTPSVLSTLIIYFAANCSEQKLSTPAATDRLDQGHSYYATIRSTWSQRCVVCCSESLLWTECMMRVRIWCVSRLKTTNMCSSSVESSPSRCSTVLLYGLGSHKASISPRQYYRSCIPRMKRGKPCFEHGTDESGIHGSPDRLHSRPGGRSAKTEKKEVVDQVCRLRVGAVRPTLTSTTGDGLRCPGEQRSTHTVDYVPAANAQTCFL